MEGYEAVEELKKIIKYVNRIGITIAQNAYPFMSQGSAVEKYIKESGLLANKKVIRLDSLSANSDQDRIIEGIRKLISQNGTH